MTPLYKHDCDRCEFLGTINIPAYHCSPYSTALIAVDLYQMCGRQYEDGPHYILRCSDEGGDYITPGNLERMIHHYFTRTTRTGVPFYMATPEQIEETCSYFGYSKEHPHGRTL